MLVQTSSGKSSRYMPYNRASDFVAMTTFGGCMDVALLPSCRYDLPEYTILTKCGRHSSRAALFDDKDIHRLRHLQLFRT